MVREWCNLKLLKWAGWGHDPEGIQATKEGDCMVVCPAGPQPGQNLPNTWEDATESIQYIYTSHLVVMLLMKTLDSYSSCSVQMQACEWFTERFPVRLLIQHWVLAAPITVRQPNIRSIWTQSVIKKIQWVVLLFKNILSIHYSIFQTSTCVKHHAVTNANTSKFANLSSSGIGTIDCIWHTMKLLKP